MDRVYPNKNMAINVNNRTKLKISPSLSFLLGSDGEASGGIGSLNFLFAFIRCLIRMCSICVLLKFPGFQMDIRISSLTTN